MDRLSRLMFAVIVFSLIGLLMGTSLAAAVAGNTLDPCPVAYTVRWGDTLAKIADRFNTSIAELMQLNRDRVRNPNFIYVGQSLCVPVPRAAAVEVTYHFTPQGSEAGWSLTTRGGLASRRAAFPIAAVDIFSTTAEISAAIHSTPMPVLLGVRAFSEAMTYTLIIIGDGRDLIPIVPTATHAFSDVLPPVEPPLRNRCQLLNFKVLGQGAADTATAVFRMEADAGTFYPFELTTFALRPDLARAANCYQDNPDLIGFALFPVGPTQPGRYRMVMRMTGDLIGPPGATRALRCSSWPRWGWFYRWLRGWYGCGG